MSEPWGQWFTMRWGACLEVGAWYSVHSVVALLPQAPRGWVHCGCFTSFLFGSICLVWVDCLGTFNSGVHDTTGSTADP